MDAASGCVRIENGGRKQSLRICTAPTLLSDSSGRGDLADDEMKAGNPGWGTLPETGNGSTANGNSSSSNGNRSSSNQNSNSGSNSAPGQSPAPNSNGVDPAAALKDQSSAEWYQESVSIEQSRLETAQSVLAGEMTPWPRTPLTPAGTPANLIAGETFFSNHIPGFVQQVPLLPAQ